MFCLLCFTNLLLLDFLSLFFILMFDIKLKDKVLNKGLMVMNSLEFIKITM